MRNLIVIPFVILAFTFCFKSIITYVASEPDSFCFFMDVDEEESSEKEDIDEKGDTEEFQLNQTDNLLSVNSLYKNIFHHHIINGFSAPVFEIHSPPPEFTI